MWQQNTKCDSDPDPFAVRGIMEQLEKLEWSQMIRWQWYINVNLLTQIVVLHNVRKYPYLQETCIKVFSVNEVSCWQLTLKWFRKNIDTLLLIFL